MKRKRLRCLFRFLSLGLLAAAAADGGGGVGGDGGVTLPAATYDHLGLVVRDTIAVGAAWAALLGVPVPGTFNNAGPGANLTYHGVHTDANILGSYLGCVNLEILEPTDGNQSLWRDQLELHGGNAPLYLGFATDRWRRADLDALSAQFASDGCPTQQMGYWWNQPGKRGCYHYIQCQDGPFGSFVEVMTRNNCTGQASRAEAEEEAAHQETLLPNITVGTASANGGGLLDCHAARRVSLVSPNATETLAAYASAFGVAVPKLRRAWATTFRGQPTRATALFGDLTMVGQDGTDVTLRVYEPEGDAAAAAAAAVTSTTIGGGSYSSSSSSSSSWWHDGLQRYGPSIHLLSFQVADVAATAAGLRGRGYRTLQQGPCYAYLDSLDALGIVVELAGTSAGGGGRCGLNV